MKISCIDLSERFPKYQIEYEKARKGRSQDPWLKIIPCRYGHIFPFGGNRLAASTTAKVGTRLMALPGTALEQDGSDGKTVLFDAADFQAVAKIIRPKRRITEKRRLAAARSMARNRLTPGKTIVAAQEIASN